MKGTVKKNWSVDQKVKFVEGLANWNGSKKDYCKKYGLNADVLRRWEIAYKNGTLVASGEKPVAKAKLVKASTTKSKAKPKAKGKTAKSVVKSSVKTKKSFFGRLGLFGRKKTIMSLTADVERLSIQLKDSRNEVFDLKNRIKDLELQKADWKNQAERLAWNA